MTQMTSARWGKTVSEVVMGLWFEVLCCVDGRALSARLRKIVKASGMTFSGVEQLGY